MIRSFRYCADYNIYSGVYLPYLILRNDDGHNEGESELDKSCNTDQTEHGCHDNPFRRVGCGHSLSSFVVFNAFFYAKCNMEDSNDSVDCNI